MKSDMYAQRKTRRPNRASSATQNQTDHTQIRVIGWTIISILLTAYILILTRGPK